MATLNACLKKHGKDLSRYESDNLKAGAKKYIADGYGPEKANVAAVEDFIADLELEREDVFKQAEGKGWVREEKTAPETKAEKKIEDFGEKIGGARKDYYAEFKDRIRDAKAVDVAEEPLSKSWPEPDYQKLIDSGVDPWMVAFVRAARDEVPTKPQSSWKLKQWVARTTFLRDFAYDLLEGKIQKEKVETALDKPEFVTVKYAVGGRADLYLAVGHERSLKGISITNARYSTYRGIEYKPSKIFWTVEQKAKASAFSNWPRELAVGETREEVIEKFKAAMETYVENPPESKAVKFQIYSKRGEEGYWVGKKIGRNYIDLKKFPTSKEAVTYRKEHQTDLEEMLAKWKVVPNERRAVNRERIGKDHRQGKDVTPEMFTEAFGFRGVEFGNWVPDKERQDNLNRAYDALMDLSLILNIPTKAISLNGELGLAFGARGVGGKMAPSAHYEPGKVVINLTRKNGPGTLAHEWWHGLDSYFSRGRGQKEGFISEKPSKLSEADKTRAELLDAFKGVMAAINETGLKMRSRELDMRRSKEYWGQGREMAARAFENYVIEKLAQTDSINDYLANIERPETFGLDTLVALLDGMTVQDIYPYLLDSEIQKVGAAYDKLFEVMETKETEKGVMLFRMEGEENALPESERGAGPTVGERPEEKEIPQVLERGSQKGEQPYRLSPKQLRNAAEATRYVYGFMKMAGAPQEVLDRIKVEAGPFIDLRGKNYEQSLDEWIRSGGDPNQLFGAATIYDTHAVVQMAMNIMNLKDLELTAYHEWYHIAKRWVMTKKDAEAIEKFFPGEEGKNGEAESFARFARTRRLEGIKGDVSALHALFMKLRRYLQIIANGLKGKGFTRPEDIFGKLFVGAYAPHFGGARGETALTMAGTGAEGRPSGLSNAIERLAKGENERDVWRETGWMKGPEGRYRWEIDDSKAVVTLPDKVGEVRTLSQVLDHPQLFKHYPMLRDYKVGIQEGKDSNFSVNKLLIGIGSKDAKASLFHEVQHAVQHLEGFARGGMPEEFKPIKVADVEIKKLDKAISELWENAPKGFKDTVRIINQEIVYKKGVPDRYDEKRFFDALDKVEAEHKDLYREYTDLYAKRYYAERDKEYMGEITPEEQYAKLFGEIESRDTSSRLGYDAEMRRLIMPYEGQGIPRDQWIVRDGTGAVTSFEVEAPKSFFRMEEQAKSKALAWIENANAQLETEFYERRGTPKEKIPDIRKAAEKAETEITEAELVELETVSKKEPLIKWMLPKIDTKVAERLLSTPLHYFKKVPALYRMFRSGERKHDNQQLMLSHLAQDLDGTWRTKILDLARKERPEEYKRYADYRLRQDRDQLGHRVKYNPDTKEYDLFAPGEKKIAQASSYSEAKRIQSEEAMKRGFTNQSIIKITQSRKEGAYELSVPKRAKIASFEDDEVAWRMARKLEEGDFKDAGFSDYMVNVLRADKTTLDAGFHALSRNVKRLKEHYQSTGQLLPELEETIDGKKHKFNLQDYLDMMGDLRGYYFPRVREPGKYMLTATKKGQGGGIRKFFDLALEDKEGVSAVRSVINSRLPIGRFARDLRKEGYLITVERADKTPEDVFQMAGSIVGMQEKIMEALEKMNSKNLTLEDFEYEVISRRVPNRRHTGMINDFAVFGPKRKKHIEIFKDMGGQFYSAYPGEKLGWHFLGKKGNFEKHLARALANVSKAVDQEATDLMTHHFMEQLANIDKGRGFRQHMIRRNMAKGEDVFTGYEEDPARAISTYTAGLAGGESKRQMAIELIRYYTGTDISWDDFQTIKAFEGTYDEFTEKYERPKRLDLPIFAPMTSREDFEAVNDPEGYKENEAKIQELTESLDKERGMGGESEATAKELDEAEAWMWNGYRTLVNDRRIDAKQQKNAFHDAKEFMADMLRNDEQVDRLIGTMKGLAVLKYLGFRVFSAPLVNLTAMATSMPAAMNTYADIPLVESMRRIGAAMANYLQYKRNPESTAPNVKAVFDEIEKRAWHKAQFNKEALTSLESKLGRKWNTLIEWSMYAFGATEQLNRAASIYAAYSALKAKSPNMAQDQLLEKAKEITDNAHSIYHKVNRPTWTRGGGIGANIALAAYVFKSFSHNYLLLMKDAWGSSWTPEHKLAFSWLALSPALLAGTGALVGKELIFMVAQALGIGGDDPEEEFYKWIADNVGDTAKRFARHGAFGLAGINVKNSLAIGITDLPSNLTDLLGAPYSVVSDSYQGITSMARGDVWKGAEKLIPSAAVANVMRGIRESTEGVTKRGNAPLFYGREPLVGDTMDAILRALSFSPVGLSEKREILYREKGVEADYSDARSEIYGKLKRFYLQPAEKRNRADYADLIAEIQEYNNRVKERGADKKGVPYITKESIKTNLKRSFQPSRRERLRESTD